MIFVTGCARSGTSLTTRILQAHGCNLGSPDRINALFENLGVRQNVLKPYLSSIGADPQGQRRPKPASIGNNGMDSLNGLSSVPGTPKSAPCNDEDILALIAGEFLL